MIIIQKFQANNHLAVIFPLVVASAVVNCETSTPLSSQAWQKITDPPLLRHRERSVAIHFTKQPVVETLNNFVYPLTSPRIRQASFFRFSIYKTRHSVMNLCRNDIV